MLAVRRGFVVRSDAWPTEKALPIRGGGRAGYDGLGTYQAWFDPGTCDSPIFHF